ncbi:MULTISPECIES: hypothetical protein [Pseudomonas]|uniref:hypothetical protein n=1 Tax=Pseudomonas TaxID=286 RepID=UPI000D6F8F2B|nr:MULTISPECIES: hypothetical protein [unclassified Pseudomonas]MED5606272.1 hypothetical protein [Pseudomonas sp. JH-2]PWU28570.1 hypothetical protein DK254_22380 [Pseudomonas sp. RW407]
MNLTRICLVFALVAPLAACTTMTPNQAIVPLQAATAQMIGLASSDELVIRDVKAGQPDPLGTQELSYTARTTKGRVFNCTSRMMPGLLISPATLSTPSCTPVVAHSN